MLAPKVWFMTAPPWRPTQALLFRSRSVQCLSENHVTRLAHSDTLPPLPLFATAFRQAESQAEPSPLAVVDTEGSWTYTTLRRDVESVRHRLTTTHEEDLQEARVAFLCPNSYAYVVTQWAIWAAGGIAVPLSPLHPPAELDYFIQDSQADTLVYHPALKDQVQRLTRDTLGGKLELLDIQEVMQQARAKRVKATTDTSLGFHLSPERRAMIVYTSGTTGRPKGVVSTHSMIQHQVDCLISAWGWSAQDRIHHVLPLHHVHGVINALNCGLASGATVEMAPRFDANQVWRRWMDPRQNLTLFTAVPAIYSKLIHAYDAMDPVQQSRARSACRQFRLMMSGSSALPSPLLRRWREISGHTLLERYGMSEIGMALSNPATDPALRREGCVGAPLPGVQVRLIDDQQRDITYQPDTPGELLVAGPNVFKEYWNRPQATREAFIDQVWFKTGDTAAHDATGVWRILGRNSQDILKSGGYKISALEIERELLSHPSIADVAVVGAPDEILGQVVAAVVKLASDVESRQLTPDTIQTWCKTRLARYKIPRRYIMLTDDEIPRNAMGKINKKNLVRQFFTT
ncbi:hypothetical protein IWQ61_000046 [Dispira simplex]|nr:hypothetical protein IWQ61_000046 [Dispira simplex]